MRVAMYRDTLSNICRARLTRVTHDVIPKNPSTPEAFSNVCTRKPRRRENFSMFAYDIKIISIFLKLRYFSCPTLRLLIPNYSLISKYNIYINKFIFIIEIYLYLLITETLFMSGWVKGQNAPRS